MTLLRTVRFLAGDGNAAGADSVLLVQSGAPETLSKAVEMARVAFPGARLTVLLQRNMRSRVPLLEGVEYLDNEGGKAALVQRLRARRFDVALALYTNDPGYWKLKILPFLVGARNVFAVNEHLDRFLISARAPAPLARHLSWRAGTGRGSGTDALIELVEGAARTAASPAIAAWLFAYEKLASARAALRGGPRWKDEHRDG